MNTHTQPESCRSLRQRGASRVALLAGLGLLLGACSGDGGEIETTAAAAEDQPADEQAADAPEAEPTADERPDLVVGSDGDLSFEAWQFVCSPIGGSADGTVDENLGRVCGARVEITNTGDAAIKVLSSWNLMVDTEGETYVADAGSKHFWAPLEPGASVSAQMGWVVPYGVDMVELRLAGSDDSAGVSLPFTDPFAA